MTFRDKRQRTFKFSGNTETQLAQVCHATGSSVTAVVEQAVAHYYRDLFGPGALLPFAVLEQSSQGSGTENGVLDDDAYEERKVTSSEKQIERL